MAIFTEILYHIGLDLLCVTFTIVHMGQVKPMYNRISGTSNFNFTVLVKVTMFASEFLLYDIGYLLHLKT